MSTVAGRNYTIEVRDDRVAHARVRRRPDLDTTAGADDASEMSTRLLELDERRVIGMILDLSEAPQVAGPRTNATLGELFASWAATQRRLAVLIGSSAMQKLQMERLIDERAVKLARVVATLDEALAWTTTR